MSKTLQEDIQYAQPAVASNAGSDASETPPDSTASSGGVASNTPESLAASIHEEHARELLAALDRIHALQGELHAARQPANWSPAEMAVQLQYLMAGGAEIVIGATRLQIIDDQLGCYDIQPAELPQTIESIQFLKQRKAA